MWSPIVVLKNRKPKPQLHSRGMTLIEVMLAVTLFSTMMGATGALLQAGFRAQSLWGGGVQAAARMERALNRLDRDIASAQKLFAVAAQGSGEQFSFARVEPMIVDGVSSPQWVKVVYRIGQGNNQRALIREVYAYPPAAGNASASQQEVLLLVEMAAWSFGRLDAQGQLVWAEAWDGLVDGVPQLVRFSCTIPTAAQNPLVMTRVFRNPAGNLPKDELQ